MGGGKGERAEFSQGKGVPLATPKNRLCNRVLQQASRCPICHTDIDQFLYTGAVVHIKLPMSSVLSSYGSAALW